MDVLRSREDANKSYAAAVRRPGDVRALALHDLFFLMVHVIGRTDMDNDWCFARCREVQASPNGHLDLWAREHYKSTIITVGLTIQDILRNPEITVGIFSHSRPIAKSFLRQIKREFEDREALRDLFPDVLWTEPRRESPKWSEDDGLIVRRKSNPKEATVEAWGLVDAQPTGKHFSLLIYDDVVTPDSVTTPDMIRKTTDAWRISLNLGAHGGVRRMIGTRYHASDTYYDILDKGSAKPRLYPATVDGTYDGEPVFLSREALAEKRRDMGPFVFACQMLQNPLADKAQGFATEWFRRLNEAPSPSGMNLYIVVDPAGAKKKDSDYTSIWVIGLNTDGNYYVLDGVHDRLNLTERANALFTLHRTYRPLAVGYERYGMQADVEHMQYRMERENYRFAIIELGGQMPKPDRIRRLVPVFEQGRVFFPWRMLRLRVDNTTCDLTDEFYRQEYTTFPVSAHDDMLDCLSRILDPELGAVFPATRSSLGDECAEQNFSIWD